MDREVLDGRLERLGLTPEQEEEVKALIEELGLELVEDQ